MMGRVVGFVVVGEAVTVVDAEIPDDAGDPLTIVNDVTWRLQKGDRPQALAVLHQRCQGYLTEHAIASAVVMGSALAQGPAKLALLTGAELRGVVIAAAASVCPVKVLAKAVISRTYGDRKVDEYVEDDAFWKSQTQGGELRKMSRTAAMLVVASRHA